MKFLDLFAGIGGFRMGLQQAGDFEPVGWIEKDKFARKSYEVIYDVRKEWTARDVRDVKGKELPEFDLLTAGFPCQSFSIAGNRGGFEDTRGTLFFEIMRLAKERQPKYLFLENVKGLLNHDGGATFGTIINTLAGLGYSVEWQVLNSKDFGVPQNRERVFIIGHLGGFGGGQVFPIRRKTSSSHKTIKRLNNFCGTIEDKEGISNTLTKSYGMQSGDGTKVVEGLNTTEEGNSYCVDSNYHKGTSPGDINSGRRTQIKVIGNTVPSGHSAGNVYDKKGLAPTVRENHGKITKTVDNMRIRKLTPKECWRLQGFPDWAYERAAEVNSDTQLYRQAGNSVTVNVIKVIGEKLKNIC